MKICDLGAGFVLGSSNRIIVLLLEGCSQLAGMTLIRL